MRAEHPTDQTLRAHRLGMLDADGAASVAAHVRACPSCRKRLDATMSMKSREGGSRPGTAGTIVGGAEARVEPVVAAVATAMPDLPDYEMIRHLGGGGMGVVYLANNTLMGRLEVLKVLAQHLVAQPRAMERFLREIQSAARLQHRNIVSAYSAIRWNNGLILAMEYVEGQDLAERVEARGPLPVAEACYYIYQAARGLHQAHRAGMVHRDVKPANLILDLVRDKGVVKILDFGLAKVTSEGPVEGGLTRQGLMLGTPDYMAPEQIRSPQKADIRADLYSLGCTMYFLLTGRPPFDGDSLYDILQAHHSTEASPLNLVRADVPAELAALVAKMMAKEPERRFQTPALVAEALLPYFRPDAVKTATRAEPVMPPVGTGRPATIVEADAYPLAPKPARQATLAEGSPAIAPKPARPPRQATIIDAGAAASPPLDIPGPRWAGVTLSEDAPALRTDRSTRPAPTTDAAAPPWRQAAVLVPVGVAAVALIALGLTLAARRPETEADPRLLARSSTTGPESPSSPPRRIAATPLAPQPVSPAPETKADAPSPGPVAVPEKADPDDGVPSSGGAPAEEPDPDENPPGEEPDEPEPPPGAKADEPTDTRAVVKAIPGPDGLVHADYAQIARSPEAYQGTKTVPNGYLIASVVTVGGKLVPGYGTLKVSDKTNRTLSSTLARSGFEGGRLGIVLDEALARRLKGYLDEKKSKSAGQTSWKIIPTFDVRRSDVARSAPWLAVITSMKLVEQNNLLLARGERDRVFRYVVFEGGGSREERVGAESYDFLDGAKEREHVISQANRQSAKRRQKDEARRLDRAIGGALQRGAANAAAQDRMIQDGIKRQAGFR